MKHYGRRREEHVMRYRLYAKGAPLVRSLNPARLPPRLSGFNPRPGQSGFSDVGIVLDDAVSRRVFSAISSFPALSLRRRSIFTLITLIGSQDLAVKSRPNLFTRLTCGSVGEEAIQHDLIFPSYFRSDNFRIYGAVPEYTLPLTPCVGFRDSRDEEVYLSTFILTGATVAERLNCSPPTKVTRIQSPAGSLRPFACGNPAEDAVGRRVFLGFSRLPRLFIPTLLHTHLNHPHRLSRPRY
ncbi:hypothetical protein PR048_031049 [Dryococelus australis]|uniref:Uncharacterized protein n=1 Tax=Dryococelus australis TaxID=614101 RepID=A0ABQ9G467_9NEOP|nr:hypothetical protein PR048_031049 [Dryococelus australis]